ncbi:MAG TPA: oxygenase MpaB family protein [Acidimicrobiia bacterium]|nr:oxygenase MpaB family protein [Acidimicrobiia bacterium]
MLDRAEGLLRSVRRTMTRATLTMFEHAPYPLKNTLEYRGDPGVLGPDAVSWRLLADVAAFAGGLRGLLIQAAHPEVVAGVGDHSRYRDDPFGRLSRTSAYVTATTFGAGPEVENAVTQVRRIHRVVKGTSSRGIPYDASDPGFSAWVHNALTDSFLVANQAYGGFPLHPAEADRFVTEQARIGALLGADPMPLTAKGLSDWVANHPDVAPSPEMRDVVEFLTNPPLRAGVKAGYLVLLEAAVATIPDRLRSVLGLSVKPGAQIAGRAGVAGLRWALGYSPSWALALERTGRPLPEGLFRQDPSARVA